jgi:HEPN domain-containing protein
VKDDPRVDTSLRTFLSRAYQLKAIADYETGPGSHVSEESAREAIQTARQFVECVTGLLPPNGPTPVATPEPDPS